MKIKEVVLEYHEISDIPAAPLWELCRSYDAEPGTALDGKYVGLRIYTYFKHQMKTGKTANTRYWKEGGDC